MGGITGQIHGITEADSAWVLAIAAHLFEDPTAWALGEVKPGGEFAITGLKEGAYIVMAGATGYLPQYYSHGYSVWEAHVVEVGANEISGGIEFFLEPFESGTGAISGHVFDEQDETPIAGAVVTAFNLNNPFVSAQTITNDDGSYTLSELRNGTYQVHAFAEGYFDGIFADSSGTGQALVTVEAGEEVTGIDFFLNRGGSISGRILDEAGDPVVGATVEAYPLTDFNVDRGDYYYGWAVTDEEGNYTISGLFDGPYVVAAHIRERTYGLTLWYDNADSFEEATPVEVTFGSETSGIDFIVDVLTDVGAIAGRIVTEDVDGVHNALVRVEPVDRTNFYYFAHTYPDEDGFYVLENVPVGAYRVVLEYWTQWFYNITYYDGVTNPEDATPVEVLADQQAEGIDFTIPSVDGVLMGTVTDEAGRPVVNAHIQISPTEYGGHPFADAFLWAFATTDKNGVFSVDQIPDGEYYVSVFYCFLWECVEQWWPEGGGPDRAEAVVVADGQSDPASIDFVLPIALGEASISGVVRHTDGRLLAGAAVSAAPYANLEPPGRPIDVFWSNQLFTTTDSLGQYSFDYLPAGTFVVNASYWEDGGFANQWYDGADSPENATPIELADGESRTDVDFSLDVIPLYGDLIGRVFFEDGTFIRRAYIEAVPLHFDFDALIWPYEQYAITDEDGAFRIENLYEGQYQVNVYAQEAEGIINDSLGVNSILVEIDGGETTAIDAPMRRQEAGPGEISGMVTSDQGESLEIAVVQAMPTTDFGAPFYTSVTDEDGNYRLANLPEGEYYLLSRGPQHLTEYYDDAFDPSDAELIQVEANQPVSGIDIALSPVYYLFTDGVTGDFAEGGPRSVSDRGSLIFGSVTDESGDPLADATVYVVNEMGAALLSAQSQADGSYEIAGIPPGAEYRLKATRIGFESRFNENTDDIQSAPAIAMNGSRMEVNFSLSESETSTGVDDESPLPADLSLLGNYPNPFRGETRISLSVSETLPVEVTVYDALGREVERLYHGVMAAGTHNVVWSPADASLSSGLYFYRVTSGQKTLTGKMVFMP